MNLSFPQLLFGSIGALLIYAAVTNKTPVGVIQEAMGISKGGSAAPPPSTQLPNGQFRQYGPYNPDGTGLQPNSAGNTYSLGAQNYRKGLQVYPV